MNGLSDWFDNNWIDLARLLVQLAIFAAVVRYGRRLLATLRASQEQLGALLRLLVSDTAAEKTAAPVAPEAELDARWQVPSMNIREPEHPRGPEPRQAPVSEPVPEPVFADGYSRSSYSAEREQSLGGRLQAPAFAAAAQSEAFAPAEEREESPALTPWVSAPSLEPERLSIPAPAVAPRPSTSTWLQQAPMRSSGASPWRKMVRWLQEPARR